METFNHFFNASEASEAFSHFSAETHPRSFMCLFLKTFPGAEMDMQMKTSYHQAYPSQYF